MSIIKHITLQKIVAHDFRYDPRISQLTIKEIIRSHETEQSWTHFTKYFPLDTGLIWKESLCTKQLQNGHSVCYTNVFTSLDVLRTNPELQALPNVTFAGTLSKQVYFNEHR